MYIWWFPCRKYHVYTICIHWIYWYMVLANPINTPEYCNHCNLKFPLLSWSDTNHNALSVIIPFWDWRERNVSCVGTACCKMSLYPPQPSFFLLLPARHSTCVIQKKDRGSKRNNPSEALLFADRNKQVRQKTIQLVEMCSCPICAHIQPSSSDISN